jgi:hypothetical protein
MAIRPIDMQTNMSQVTEVGKDAQARMDAVVGQQHGLEKESGEKARLVNTKLDQLKKGESATIRDQQKKGEKKHGEAKEERPVDDKKKLRTGRSKDSRMGNIIDILK